MAVALRAGVSLQNGRYAKTERLSGYVSDYPLILLENSHAEQNLSHRGQITVGGP